MPPGLSVLASQARLIDVSVFEGERRPVGTDGGVVSAGGGGLLTVTVTLADKVVLPAASRARAVRL